jgi:hypothetical protein
MGWVDARTASEFDLNLELASPLRAVAGWMLLAFLVTFVATRLITRMIRAGRGPFRNAAVGGVHAHHLVYGIFLMLGAGTLQFAFHPDEPWVLVLAVLFACGAALTLDEFALWLYLRDVYWTQEGRKSVDAVVVAAALGGLLLLGANPFGVESDAGELGIALTIMVNLALTFLTILKGKPIMGLIGLLLPVVSLVGAIRLARPSSPWARRFYPEGSYRLVRSRARYPADRRTRWDGLLDTVAGTPSRGVDHASGS